MKKGRKKERKKKQRKKKGRKKERLKGKGRKERKRKNKYEKSLVFCRTAFLKLSDAFFYFLLLVGKLSTSSLRSDKIVTL